MPSTYLFYDIETTGLNKCFDQVLQFAAIRTDLSLHELERYDMTVQLTSDVIPAPEAMITHRLRLSELALGRAELEVIREIHGLMNTPSTISLGYNSLGFDDEFLRFSFYRHLLSPYTHQYAAQCQRMDLYPITVLYYLFKRDTLHWPHVDGKTNLQLAQLSKANHWSVGPAHRAISDAEAALSLAHQLIQERTLWDDAVSHFDKKMEGHRYQQLSTVFTVGNKIYKEALLVQGQLGFDLCYQTPVLSLGQHRHYKNQSLWLRLDTEQLQKTTLNDVASTTVILRKRAGEQPLLLPTHRRFLIHLSHERQQLALENKAWLQAHPDVLQNICDYYQHYQYPRWEHVDIDAALYDLDFPTPHEEQLFQQFHKTPPQKKENIAKQFPNALRQQQAIRLLGRYDPDALSAEGREQWLSHLRDLHTTLTTCPTDYRGNPRLTVPTAITQLTKLKTHHPLDAEQEAILNELERYYRSL